MRVLVAEDVEDLAMAIAAGLRREGMAVDVVLDGTTALDGPDAEFRQLGETRHRQRSWRDTHCGFPARRRPGHPGQLPLTCTAAFPASAHARPV